MFKRIQILGAECPNCRRLAENARVAADQLGLDYLVQRTADLRPFAQFAVVMPAMAVDGELVFSGRVPDVESIKRQIAV
jgi:small redox-active disulfide protein 2